MLKLSGSFFVLIALATPANAWEFTNLENPRLGFATTVAQIVDVAHLPVTIGPAGPVNDGRGNYVRFSDPNVGAICRQLHGFNEDVNDERQRNGYAPYGKFVQVVSNNATRDRFMPIILFAKAHNLPVRVYIRAEGQTCRIQAIITCSSADSCN